MILWMLACGGTAAPELAIEGCWVALPGKKVRECYGPNGEYIVHSPRMESQMGKWSLSGGDLTLTVGPFPTEVFKVSMEGEQLVVASDTIRTVLVREEPKAE